jgi:hypothetical protein
LEGTFTVTYRSRIWNHHVAIKQVIKVSSDQHPFLVVSLLELESVLPLAVFWTV